MKKKIQWIKSVELRFHCQSACDVLVWTTNGVHKNNQTSCQIVIQSTKQTTQQEYKVASKSLKGEQFLYVISGGQTEVWLSAQQQVSLNSFPTGHCRHAIK